MRGGGETKADGKRVDLGLGTAERFVKEMPNVNVDIRYELNSSLAHSSNHPLLASLINYETVA